MDNKMTIEEFIQEHNYQCNGAEEQGDEVLFILKSLLTNSFKLYCGEVPNFDFINKKGQIALINEKVKIGNVDLGPEYEDEKNQELFYMNSYTEADIDNFIKENSNLMDDLKDKK